MAKKKTAEQKPLTGMIENPATPGVATPTTLSTGVFKPPGTMFPAANFSLIASPQIAEAVAENLKGEQITEFDLPRVKVPAGGGTAWQVPTLEGVKNVDAIEGLILYAGIRRAFWEDPNPTGDAPDCASKDGLVGIGDPGIECAVCPHNEWGSAVKQNGQPGAGKRCREMRSLLILRPEDNLPIFISAPPSSLRGWKRYLMTLPGIPLVQVVTRLKLKPEKNGDGIAYSEIVFEYGGYVEQEAVAGLRGLKDTLAAVLMATTPARYDAATMGVGSDSESVEFNPEQYDAEAAAKT